MLNFDWIANLSLGWAKFIVIMAFVVPWIFALLQKRSYLYQGAPDNARWRDLKIWATIVVAIQISIYIIF